MMWVLPASNMYYSLIVPVSLWVTLGYFQGGLQEFWLVYEHSKRPSQDKTAHGEASALSFNSTIFFHLAMHSSKNKFLKYTMNDLPKIQWEMSLVILVSTPQTEFIISTTILCTSL